MAGVSHTTRSHSSMSSADRAVAPLMRTRLPPSPLADRNARADLDLAVGSVEPGVQRKAAVAALACDIGVRRTAQAAPGRQKGNRFEEVGLAGAIVAGKHHGARREIDRQRRIVAKIGKC